MELSDTMHDSPMQTGQPNGVRSSDWLGMAVEFMGRYVEPRLGMPLEHALGTWEYDHKPLLPLG
jgi:hypothetical protein